MNNRERVNEIDLLRLLAALAVVFYHYGFRGYAADNMTHMPYPALAPLAMYGYLGVQLFFMISGFVILMTASSGSLKSFVISRVVRLYPAFWVCCTITFLVCLLWGGTLYPVSFKQFLVNMTMFSGFVGVPAIDGVYWSLFVEMRFYAMVALVLWLGQIVRAQQWLLGWLALALLLECLPATWPLMGKLRFLLIVDYAAWFVGGALCYLIWHQGPNWQRLLALPFCYLLAVLQAVRSLDKFEAHYHVRPDLPITLLLVTAIFGLMLLVALRRTGPIGRRPWLLAGALTYPLYLLHQNIGFIVFNYAYPQWNPHLLLWGMVVVMLLAAWAVNRLVERPLTPKFKALLVRLWP
jgi:peptidoglycan/LPS O-acetylase OafA/YrhL